MVCEGCPIKNCAVLRWDCPTKSGVILAAGNAVLLTFALNLPIFSFFLQYGLFLLLIAGAVVKFGKVCDTSMFKLENFCKKEVCVGLADKAYDCFSKMYARVLAVLSWEDIQSSSVALAFMYLFGGLLASLNLFLVSLLAWNVLFAYGKFQDILEPLAKPHLDRAKVELNKLYKMIPRHQSAATEEDKKE